MGINKDQEKYTQNKDSSLARIIVVLIIQVCYFITFPFLSYSFPWSFTNILLISITIQAPFTTSHSISKWPIYKADSPSLPSPFLTKPIVLSNTYYPWRPEAVRALRRARRKRRTSLSWRSKKECKMVK